MTNYPSYDVQITSNTNDGYRREAALGALLVSAVFLTIIYGVIEYALGGHTDYIFVAMEVVHFFGILILIRKLLREKSCEGERISTVWQSRLRMAITSLVPNFLCYVRLICEVSRIDSDLLAFEVRYSL